MAILNAPKKRLDELDEFTDITVQDGHLFFTQGNKPYKFPIAVLQAILSGYVTQAQKIAFGTVFPLKKLDGGSAATLDCAAASEFVITLTDPTCAISITNALTDPDLAQQLTLTLVQGTGSNKVTWPENVKWPHDFEPVLSYSQGQLDQVSLMTYDNGQTWLGSLPAPGYPA